MVKHILQFSSMVLALAALVVGLVLAPSAFAGITIEEADVISASPIIRKISVPSKECWQEETTASSTGGKVLGGLIGGLLGNQIGEGSGKKAATVAATIAGTMIGGGNGDGDTHFVEKCREVREYRDQTVGYRVVARLSNGQELSGESRTEPGLTIRVEVDTRYRIMR